MVIVEKSWLFRDDFTDRGRQFYEFGLHFLQSSLPPICPKFLRNHMNCRHITLDRFNKELSFAHVAAQNANAESPLSITSLWTYNAKKWN